MKRMAVAVNVAVAVAAVLLVQAAFAQDERPRNRFEQDILVDSFGYDESSPSSVAIGELYQGCPRRDCIPSIDEPGYEAVEAAVRWLDEDALVMTIDVNGDQRAFPVQILDRHEIVNDTIGGREVAVTWCPLCGSGVAFERRIDGEVVEFGVSGLLHGSDLVMYDRTSETLWQQITGEAFMGPKRGQTLDTVPLGFSEFGQWADKHPNGQVLERPSRWGIDYSRRPYGDYDESDRLMFPAGKRDFSIHPKSVVFGFEIAGEKLAVMETSLSEGTLDVDFAGRSLMINRNNDGTVVARDAQGNEWAAIRLFWFAWYNFNPETARI